MLVSATRVYRASSVSRPLLAASALPSKSHRYPTLASKSISTYSRRAQPNGLRDGIQTTSGSPSRGLASFIGSSSFTPEPNALQVTDPLLIYRAKVARGELEEDEEQLRALIELRRINRKLRDYVPPAHLLGILHDDSQSASSAALASAIDSRLRPGAKEFQDDSSARTRSKASGENIGELVRWLSESEGLAELGTPKGLLITGTPGTGKSMVMDIFYDSLPTKYKFRRHYHHLLLDLYKIIWQEAERRRLAVRQGTPRPTATPEIGTGAVWTRDPSAANKSSAWRRALRGMPFFRPDSLADDGHEKLQYIPGPDGDVVKTTLPLHAAAHLFLNHGHILLFDEIQLVDVASAGLLRRTLEAYWRLGGVVIGTSNRIPKDLYASNVQRGQLTQFLEILQERCPNHEMRRSRDFRREPFYRQEWLDRNEGVEGSDEQGQNSSGSDPSADVQSTAQTSYFLRNEADKYDSLVADVVGGRTAVPTTLNVYGRKLHVPRSIAATDQLPSVCRFTFSELCDSPLGPADYLTLASTYHTFILEGVPQMTLMQKNQARRMITLLDAVYEAGCRLVVLADAGPDDLFFPDAEGAARHAARGPAAGPGDVRPELQYSNAMEDVVDMSTKGGRSPFLTPPPGQSYPEEEHLARLKSGQRVDFNQDEFMTESLIMAETLSEAMQDTEEGFRPNISAYSSEKPLRSASEPASTKDDKVGFKHLAIFSGEDERFSYQRAVSRLFEMSHPDWMRRKGWRPFLSNEMDAWAGTSASASASKQDVAGAVGKAVVANELNEAHRHLDRAASAAGATTAQLSSDSPGRFVDPSGDFAEEASYETSSFPGRRDAQTKLEQEMEDWAARQLEQQRQQAREAAQGANEYAAPDFSPGPIGKKRNRDQGPPVLSEAHVWGVREDWGKKAGAWGKGSAIFADDAAPDSANRTAGSTRRSSVSPNVSRPTSHSNAGGSGSSGNGNKRHFSSSSSRSARSLDFYHTLQVPRGATQAQIKSQFYKLSKELHPDVNPSEDAKKRFQEVSEAYATLGHVANRRSYDRQSQPSSSSSGGYGDNVGASGGYGGGGGYYYNAEDNANRRARATYAWDYQRRRRAQESQSGVGGRQTHSSLFNEGMTGGGGGDNAFETLAAQQRAREARNRARQTGSHASTMQDRAYQADVANPLVRFGQVVAMLYLVYKAGTFFVGHNNADRATTARKRN